MNYLYNILYVILVLIIYKVVIKPVYVIMYYKIKFGKKIYAYYFPLLGILNWIKPSEQKYGHPFGKLDEVVQQNPQVLAIITNLGLKPCIIMVNPESIKGITNDNFSCFQKATPIFNYEILKDGIIFTQGKKWKHQRMMMAPSFNFDTLQARFPQWKQTTKQHMETIKQQFPKSNDYQVMHVMESMMQLSGELGVRSFFGADFSNMKVDGQPAAIAMAHLVSDTLSHSLNDPFFLMKVLVLGEKNSMIILSPKEQVLIERSQKFMDITMAIIDDKIQKINKIQSFQPLKEDFIDMMISAYLAQKDEKDIDESQQITKEEVMIKKQLQSQLFLFHFISLIQSNQIQLHLIKKNQIYQQCLTMFIAALDNTGAAMGYCLYCMCQYPEASAQMLQQIERLVPGSPDDMEFSVLTKMDYTNSFIKETLRFYNPSMGLFHRIVKEKNEIMGIPLLQDMWASVFWYGPWKNENYFKNANSFMPERWMQGAYEIHPFAFTPFSAGPRNCLGMHMTMMEIKILLIYFSKTFNIIENPATKLKLVLHLIVYPENDTLLKIQQQ